MKAAAEATGKVVGAAAGATGKAVGAVEAAAEVMSDKAVAIVTRPKGRKTARAQKLLIYAVSLLCLIVLLAVITEALYLDARPPLPPRNIIFMVSDGFGEAGLTLARYYKNTVVHAQPNILDPLRDLNLDTFATGNVHTYPAGPGLITDSAAGATAWACALKTHNHKVAYDVNNRPCGTLLEAAKAAGMATGVAVTSSVTDATPAAFTTHSLTRCLQDSIALQYAEHGGVDVVLGGGRSYFDRQGLFDAPSAAFPKGYGVDTVAALEAADEAPLLGLFAPQHLPWEIDRDPAAVPSLRQMAKKAVELLVKKGGDRGFFLLVEGSKIDKAAHPNDAGAYVREILAYDEAVGEMLNFARGRKDTLVISTSDHETGGFSLGRGVIGGTTDPPQKEAPLHTRSLVAEAEGAMDTEYTLHLDVLQRQTISAEAMADRALADAGVASEAQLAASPDLRATLAAELAHALARHAGVEDLQEHERAFLETAVDVYAQHDINTTVTGPNGVVVPITVEDWPLHPQHKRGLQRALGSIVSARAKVGWSTFGHTATDVKLHAYGCGAEHFMGSIENVEIGRRLSRLMGFDLEAITARLGTPLYTSAEAPAST